LYIHHSCFTHSILNAPSICLRLTNANRLLLANITCLLPPPSRTSLDSRNSRFIDITPIQSRTPCNTAVFTPVLYRLQISRPLYGYGYGGTRNHIGTVSIRPYAVYGTVLSPSPHTHTLSLLSPSPLALSHSLQITNPPRTSILYQTHSSVDLPPAWDS